MMLKVDTVLWEELTNLPQQEKLNLLWGSKKTRIEARPIQRLLKGGTVFAVHDSYRGRDMNKKEQKKRRKEDVAGEITMAFT
jgi:hypothetical protein